MPKEITHWYVAAQLLPHLSPEIYAPVHKYHNLYLLSAMAPDILFYYKKGPEQNLFRKNAEMLHGECQNDTYSPLKTLIRRYGPSMPEPVQAFICGYASHIMTDSAFHPLVLHYAGKNKYDHHAMETILDIFFMKNSCLPIIRHVGKLLRRLEISRSEVLSLLGLALFSGNDYPQRELASGLRQYSQTQRFFWNRFGCWIIRRTAHRDAALRDSVSSYYHREFVPYASAFANPISYLHPVTGEAICETAVEIGNKAVKKTAEVIERIFRSRKTSEWLLDTESLIGPSLFTGLSSDSSTEMIHFSPDRVSALFGTGYELV